MRFQGLFHLFYYFSLALAMKRRAPDSGAEDTQITKFQRTDEEDIGIVNHQYLIIDIWEVIFHVSDGATLLPLVLTCKAFYSKIMGTEELVSMLHGPSGILERLTIRRRIITAHDLPLLEMSLPAALNPVVDIERLASLLVKMVSRKASHRILNSFLAITNDAQGLVDELVKKFAHYNHLDNFPGTMDEFEEYIRAHPDGSMCEGLPTIGFLLPYLHLTYSEALSSRLLHDELLKAWMAVRSAIGSSTDIPSASSFGDSLRGMTLKHWHRRLRILARYVTAKSVKEIAQMLHAIATFYSGKSHSDLHVLFRFFFSEIFHWTPFTAGLYFDGKMKDVRNLIASGDIDMFELFKLAFKWKVPLKPLIGTFNDWNEIKRQKAGMRKAFEPFRFFLENVKTLNIDDITQEDYQLATSLVPCVMSQDELNSNFAHILHVPDECFEFMMTAITKAPRYFECLPEILLGETDHWSIDALGNANPSSSSNSSTFLLSFQSVQQVIRLFKVCNAIGYSMLFLGNACQDVKRVWTAGKNVEQFQNLLSGLPDEITSALAAHLKDHWLLPYALLHSQRMNDFTAMFPYLVVHWDIDENEITVDEEGLKKICSTFRLN